MSSLWYLEGLVPKGGILSYTIAMVGEYVTNCCLYSAHKLCQITWHSGLLAQLEQHIIVGIYCLSQRYTISYTNPLPDTPSKGCSESSASSEGNPETSLDSAPSNLKSGPTFFGNPPSHSGDRVAPTASNIKGWVIKVIHNVKGQWWSGSMGNARWSPWS